MEQKTSEADAWLTCLRSLAPLFDMAYNGIVIVDAHGTIQIYNAAARKVLNIEAKDVLDRPIREINPEPWEEMKQIIKTGAPQIARRIALGNSTIIANRTPIIFNDEVRGVLSIFQDISEYDKVVSDLESFKSLSAELDAIIEYSYDGLYITDGQAKTLRVNHAYERITGFKKDDLVGKSTHDLVQKGFFNPSVTLDVIHERTAKTIMQSIKGEKTVMVTGNPIFDSSGNIARVVTNVRDLTELNQLKNALEESRQLARKYQDQLQQQESLMQAEQDMVVKSPPMRLVIQKALKIAMVDSTVLLTGESGVGKDILARFIHKNSNRKQHNFVKINSGAIPENLLESELFGYEKGAFTGAKGEGKAGLLEIADGGTVYLDEIAELPLYLQVKILGVIEDKEITRLGSTKPKPIDFKLIAATNRDIESMTEAGHFRKDLYFRLSTLPLFIPPLRERREDIVPLINYFLKKFNESLETKKTFSAELYEYLSRYAFPGNVRELRHIVEGLVVMSEKKTIALEDASLVLRKDSADQAIVSMKGNLKQKVAAFEKKIIEDALQTHKTLEGVASFLGLNQSTISRKIDLYGINRK